MDEARSVRLENTEPDVEHQLQSCPVIAVSDGVVRATGLAPIPVISTDAALNSAGADEKFMARALELALADANTAGGTGIACVIVRDGTILAEATNQVRARTNPTAHAEMVAIERACQAIGNSSLDGAILYSTLQPCGMCTMASIWSKVGRIVYGAGRDQVHRMYFEDRHLDTMDFIRDAFRDDLSLHGDVLGSACAKLYVQPGENVPIEQQGNI